MAGFEAVSPACSPLSVAPMIQWTNSHFRNLTRTLTSRTLLYSEMIMDSALVGQHHYKRNGLGVLSPWLVALPGEQPLAYQLGGGGLDGVSCLAAAGSRPVIEGGVNLPSAEQLALAADLVCSYAAENGIEPAEININSGCPSSKALRGGFGADLMRATANDHTRAVVSSVVRRVGARSEVTVKCRIGVCAPAAQPEDSRMTYRSLCEYVAGVKSAGVKRVIVHSRVCVLSGLSTAMNRTVPPLKYSVVRNLVRDFPDMDFVLNGGLRSLSEAESVLGRAGDGGLVYAMGGGGGGEDAEKYGSDFDWEIGSGASGFPQGAMIGRAVYNDPGMLFDADERFFGAPGPAAGASWGDVLERYWDYAETLDGSNKNNSLNEVIKPLHNVFANVVGNREYKQKLDRLVQEEGRKAKKRDKGTVGGEGGGEGGGKVGSLVREALEDTIDRSFIEAPIEVARKRGVYGR